ncbi:MAG: hypothetical protein H0V70_28585 [Ktedonobacteraceae bacterium]|nr:hypothetical protein [Ktedonobacteraceae bacterium]
MTKTATIEPEASQKDETRQQRKKQARKEAKTMLKIERAKKDVKKAQKKMTRAQSTFDESQAHLHDLEEKLQQIRSPQEPAVEETPTYQAPSEELPELQPEDFKTQEAVDEAYQEPLLLENTSSEEQPLTESDTSVSTDPELTTPSTEASIETDTTTSETTSSSDEYQSPEDASVSGTHGYSTWQEEHSQAENQ